VNKIIPQTLKRAYGVHHSNLPNFSADEFSSSEVWMIAYKLLCYINVSFQNRSTVMHSTIKLIDLRDTRLVTHVKQHVTTSHHFVFLITTTSKKNITSNSKKTTQYEVHTQNKQTTASFHHQNYYYYTTTTGGVV